MLMPIAPPPGICLSASPYAVGKDLAYVSTGSGSFRQGQGRWASGSNVEFVAGFPQKIAGWAQATSVPTTGTPRAICVWRDNSGNARTGIGTDTHLYSMLSGALTDITPLRTISSGTLTNAITTTANNPLVAIADSSQKLQNGDWVFLSAASAVGGITLNGWYQVSSRTGTGYEIIVPVAPSGSASGGGGTLTYQYPRVTLTNPFSTVSGSETVTVAHASHGALAGNFVDYSGASSVGGLTLNGEYQIASIVDSGHYTITAASAAGSTAGPGGGSVSVTYDIQVQQNTSSTPAGYGTGPYGAGAFGVGLVSVPVLTNGWTLAAYGNQLLAAPIGGTIYVFNPVYGGRAYPLLNAPVSLNAMFVTPERFVVALGINGTLMQLAWCDQNDYTQWTTDVPAINTANTGRTLVGGSYLVGGIGIRDGVSLIFSDRCVFQMNYTGDNEVYSTPQIGDQCGLVDPTAVCVEGGVAYWFSDQDFWTWNGGVSALPSDDVRAYVFDGGINRQYFSRCTTVLNRAKRQVRFYYPSVSATENDSGMIYHYDQQCFSPLSFGRSCGADAELLATPLGADTSNLIYYEETGTDANGSALPCSLGLGETDLSNGDKNAGIMGFIPDFDYLAGTINLQVFSYYYSPPLTVIGPPNAISVSGTRIDLRQDGKAYSFQFQASQTGMDFRLGVCRIDVQPSGARN